MKPLAIPSSFTTTFTLEYGVSEADLRRLYENAKRDQWNASGDIDWTLPATSDGRVIADELLDLYGSPLWESLSERRLTCPGHMCLPMDWAGQG